MGKDNALSSLEQLKILDYLQYNSYNSDRYKFFYVSTPKVACTTLKWWFAALEGCSQALQQINDSAESDPELAIHDTFYKIAPHVTGLTKEQLTHILRSDAYFRFAFVRNPYKRIFSAWQSKLLLREPLQIDRYKELDFFNHKITNSHDIASAFEGFLEHLASREAPSYWDYHWTPQYSLLRPDLISYSEVAQIENPKKLVDILTNWQGSGIPAPLSDIRTNESIIQFSPDFITSRSSELIHSLYALDFKFFGYDVSIPVAKKNISANELQVALQSIKLIRARHQQLENRAETINKLSLLITEQKEQVIHLNQLVEEQYTQLVQMSDEKSKCDAKIL